MKRVVIPEFFARLKKAMPDPKTELEYVNPYTLLVAVVLSAQATDAGVNRATRDLFKYINTPAKDGEARRSALGNTSRPSAWRNESQERHRAVASILIEQHDGKVPHTREALEALPGVGRKTANVVLNVAFGEPPSPSTPTSSASPTAPVWPPARIRCEVELKLLKITPAKYLHSAHHWLILHGRYVPGAQA